MIKLVTVSHLLAPKFGALHIFNIILKWNQILDKKSKTGKNVKQKGLEPKKSVVSYLRNFYVEERYYGVSTGPQNA